MSNLKHLARSLGLSIPTVSRALEGYSDVAPATRERFRAAAKATDYRPSSAARSLRRRKAEAVAVTLPMESGRFGPPVCLNMLAASGQRLSEEQGSERVWALKEYGLMAGRDFCGLQTILPVQQVPRGTHGPMS